MFIDCEKFPAQQLYRLLIGCVVPRPIAWVSSQSPGGSLNLAPFSFFNAFSANPPVLGLGIGSRRIAGSDGSQERVPKDTYLNIRSTEEFVVNVVSKPFVEKMVQTSGDYEPDVSEFDEANIETVASTMVKPPRVADSRIAMECKLIQTVNLNFTNLILGQIVCMHIDESVYKDDSIDLMALEAVGRLSGNSYCDTTSIYDIPRPVIERG